MATKSQKKRARDCMSPDRSVRDHPRGSSGKEKKEMKKEGREWGNKTLDFTIFDSR